MRTIVEQELKDILDKHGKYLRSEPGGERANLRSANLYGADLSRANLSNADLSNADLSSANLSSADLSSASLGEIKSDLEEVLGESKPELAGLYDALMRGKIDGSAYKGECACLMGTIANCRKVDIDTLTKNSNRPAERWFLGIRKGDTPQSNQISEITRQWIEEFANINDIKLPKFKLISSDEFPGAFL